VRVGGTSAREAQCVVDRDRVAELGRRQPFSGSLAFSQPQRPVDETKEAPCSSPGPRISGGLGGASALSRPRRSIRAVGSRSQQPREMVGLGIPGHSR
jgi:hypothetical protein